MPDDGNYHGGMNKKRIVLITIIVFILLSVVIIGFNWKNIGKKREGPEELVAMDIQVAALNESKIVHIDFPFYTYALNYGNALTGEHGGIVRKELARNLRDKEIPEKTVKQLKELVERMQEDPSSESNQTSFDENNYTYKVNIHTRKVKHQAIITKATGYGALPECWPEFAELINNIIEVHALDANPKIIAFSNEWYKKAFAIDDSVFEYGSFDDMVRSQKLGMADIIGDKLWTPMSPIGKYQLKFTAVDWDELDKLVAREIQTVDSTEEEFIEFVDKYFAAVGDSKYPIEYSTMETDAGTIYGVITNGGETIMIFRSCEWQPEKNYDETYALIDRGGPEGMVYTWPVYYSLDGKYILAISSNQEKYFKAFGLIE